MYQSLLLSMVDLIKENQIIIEKNSKKLLELNDEIIELKKIRELQKIRDNNVNDDNNLFDIRERIQENLKRQGIVLTSEDIRKTISDIRDGIIE